MAFCCTIEPISRPVPSDTSTLDLMTLAGRVSASRTLPAMSTTWSLSEELVVGRQQPDRLLRLALTDLAHCADLCAVLVVDRILVVDLDQLGLLVDDEHW